MMRSAQIRGMSFLICAVMISTTGCAYQFIDDEGNRRIIGFANVVVEPTMSCESSQLVSVSTIGVSTVNLPSHGGITIGYSRNSSIAIPNDTYIDLANENYNETD
ncbi:MAG: hypothetical protein QNI99_21275 [Woeseiaceae bacterium]|nr:hypothetical protein [Woeseiaceae bacterium]